MDQTERVLLAVLAGLTASFVTFMLIGHTDNVTAVVMGILMGTSASFLLQCIAGVTYRGRR